MDTTEASGMAAWIWAVLGIGIFLVVGGLLYLVGSSIWRLATRKSPTVTNGIGVTDITSTTTTIHGTVIDTGGLDTHVVIHWGQNNGGADVERWAHHEVIGLKGKGPFSYQIFGLEPGKWYYSTAQGINEKGEGWSLAGSLEFFAPIALPIVETAEPFEVDENRATLRGMIISTGGEDPLVDLFVGQSDGGEDPDQWSTHLPLGARSTGVFSKALTFTGEGDWVYRWRIRNAAGQIWSRSQTLQLSVPAPIGEET